VTLTDKNSMRLLYIIFKKYYAIVNNLLWINLYCIAFYSKYNRFSGKALQQLW
jgi:hypothetical protein